MPGSPSIHTVPPTPAATSTSRSRSRRASASRPTKTSLFACRNALGPDGSSATSTPAAPSGASSPLSTTACAWRSAGPGLVPSSRISVSRASRNTASASACRPPRLSAIISSARSDSRNG